MSSALRPSLVRLVFAPRCNTAAGELRVYRTFVATGDSDAAEPQHARAILLPVRNSRYIFFIYYYTDIIMDTTIDRQRFINDGFIRIENAFSEEVAREARSILWKDTGCDPDDPATWTKPVIRLGMYTQGPFVQAANTEILHRAFDQLVGKGRWMPCRSMGSFPVRFPSPDDPGDTGWHVDAGFPGADPNNFFEWRINVKSKGRALLMLFLFSDVGENDAPTKIRSGSHLDVARVLQTAGEAGLSFMELAGKLAELPAREEVLATGKAGTVYLCHPFLVHSAQAHRGTEPKFMAQPPLLFRNELIIEQAHGEYTPVEEAIRLGLGK